MPERVTVMSRSEKSAEAIVAACLERRAEGVGGGASGSRIWNVSDVRSSEARQYGLPGEARKVLAARNRIGRTRNKQPQEACRDFLKCADLNYSNRPVRTRMPGGVGGVGQFSGRPYPDLWERLVLLHSRPTEQDGERQV